MYFIAVKAIRLKTACHIIVYFLSIPSLFAQQYYFRGEVKDEAGIPLQNVTIVQHSTGYLFRSGSSGTFGIISRQEKDTFSFIFDGYHPEKSALKAGDYSSIRLKKKTIAATDVHKVKLASLTKNLEREEQKKWFAGDETYASVVENLFVDARRYPGTGMSLNIDRASYSNIRRFITQKSFVPPDAVRIEEMLNYFPLRYHEPSGNEMFHLKTTLGGCPWNPNNQLFFLNLSARKLDLVALPPSNLVFLIDVSGSMDLTNRLPLLKSAFKLLVDNLREKDSVSIVVYGGFTGIMLSATSGAEKEKILKAIDELTPEGNTPGESGIKMAYAIARRHYIEGGNNRVILATDGDFNVGLKTEEELDELITQQKESGIYLTCLGVGMGNYKDSKIQTLAKKGNGNFSYLDNFREAEKVLLKEFTQTLYTVADDVYMNVEFNPDYVKEYRLIGFDNRVGAMKDSSFVVEGGEIGSAYSMIAMFEVVPTEKNKLACKNPEAKSNLAEIKLQYKEPGGMEVKEQGFTAAFSFVPFASLDRCLRFSSAVAMFGSFLRESSFVKQAGWNELIMATEQSYDKDDLLQTEFLSIVQQAKLLYSKKPKKKKKDRTGNQ